MGQSTSNAFNWTLHSGETKTLDTGPDSAQAGDFYLYIEASNAQKAEIAR